MMKIAGIGVIFSQGLGISVFESALLHGWQKPGETAAHWLGGGASPAYLVDFNALPDKTLLKKIRRSDTVSKMTLLAAGDALSDSGIEDITQKRIGIVVATAFGPHVTTFGFLDDILDHGDAAVSPTTFSNSVHNAAASYVSMALKIKGPTLTVSQFRFSFQAALQVAQAWIEQGRCDYVLAGAVDEYGDVLGYVADHKLTTAGDGRIKPFAFHPTCQVPGEGAVFLLLSKTSEGNQYCAVNAVHTSADPDQGKPVDIDIIDADGMLPDESAYRAVLSPDIPAAAYSPLFGSMMIGSAFNVAAGALMLKQQMHYAVPVQDNPHHIRMIERSESVRVESVRCTGINCYAERSVIYLTKV
jgi:3-oxoacyl-[acyl-carrier-protein] synthase II